MAALNGGCYGRGGRSRTAGYGSDVVVPEKMKVYDGTIEVPQVA